MEVLLPKKRYYKISEVAQAFGVNTSLIRYWSDEFDFVKPKKNAKGDRMYTEADVAQLKTIYHLVKEKGFTLDGVRKQIKQQGQTILDQQHIIDKLEGIKQELITIKNSL